MGLHQQIAPIQESGGETCITVGTFDGVHKGHQALLERLSCVASQNEVRSVALSFRQPPRSIIDPSKKTPTLYDVKKRVELIRQFGIDTVGLIDFDDAIRVMSADEFLTTLQASLGMKHLVIGERAIMGHNRQNVDQIAMIASRNGFQLHIVSPVLRNDRVVSSSLIRAALAQGYAKNAAAMLGRLYERGGMVVHGKARARTLGVPTANMEWSRDLVMPAKGIYATWANLPDGRVLPSGTYVGDNPTFGGNSPAFEVHIADFDEDLYGQHVTVEFIEFIRTDDKFDSVEELEAQIEKDVVQINQLFETLPPSKDSSQN